MNLPDASQNSPTPPSYHWMLRPRGATATEYLVILVLAVLGIVGAIVVFGGEQEAQLQEATDTVASASADSRSGQAGGPGDAASEDESSTGSSSSSASQASSDSDEEQAIATGTATNRDEGCGMAFNPLVLLVFIIGTGVLVYLFFFDKTEE